jgi:hypothetical protein
MQRGVRAECAEARARTEMLERLDCIPIVVQALKHIDAALEQFFEAKFGEGTVIRGDPAPEVYRRLFIQAGPLVSAVGTIFHDLLDQRRGVCVADGHCTRNGCSRSLCLEPHPNQRLCSIAVLPTDGTAEKSHCDF